MESHFCFCLQTVLTEFCRPCNPLIQGNVTRWSALKAVLLGYFKPANYMFKTHQVLAKCSQCGTVTEKITQFSEKYTKYSDVDSTEAMFWFINNLQPSVQAWVHTQ